MSLSSLRTRTSRSASSVACRRAVALLSTAVVGSVCVVSVLLDREADIFPLRYFTVLSAVGTSVGAVWFMVRPGARAAATLWMFGQGTFLSALVFWAGIYPFHGVVDRVWGRIGSVGMHVVLVVPLAWALTLWLREREFQPRVVWAVAWPVVYAAVTLTSLVVWPELEPPYDFLNVGLLGVGGVVASMVAIAAVQYGLFCVVTGTMRFFQDRRVEREASPQDRVSARGGWWRRVVETARHPIMRARPAPE